MCRVERRKEKRKGGYKPGFRSKGKEERNNKIQEKNVVVLQNVYFKL